MRIVVVDDEFYTRKALTKCIGDSFLSCGIEDAEFIECVSAEAALAYIDNTPVDIVFTDIRMGEMDGLNLCEQLCKQHPAIELVIITGYAEFNYAQQAIKSGVLRYLLKPVNEDEILGVVQEFLQRHTQRSSDNELTNQVESQWMDAFAGSPLCQQGYAMVVIRPDNAGGFSPEGRAKMSQATAQLAQNSIELFSGASESIALIPLSGAVVRMSGRDTFIGLVWQILSCAHQSHLIAMSSGLSAYHQGNHTLRDAYLEATRSSAPFIPLARQHAVPPHFSAVYLDAITRKLIDHYLETGKIVEIEALVIASLDNHVRALKVDPFNCHRFLQEAICYLLHASKECAYEPRLKRGLAFCGVHPYLSIDDCKFYFSHLIADIASVVSPASGNQQAITKRLIDYIEEHYMEDLNLSDIAQNDFFMHPNYLSKLLKDMTGSSFSKYLLDVRMKNAQSLLRHRDLSISTIAQLVGYNSESHFVQVFRRYYGKTPGCYRKDMWAEGKDKL